MNNDKRICTITHHTVLNYGAVLQTYALQKAIEKLGYKSEVLDYDSERVKRVYITDFSQVKTLKQFIKYVCFPLDNKRKKNISNFVKNNIKLSEKKYTKEELVLANDKYDLFITGSDQVWNLNIHQGDTSYMLDFVNESFKKGSYAASFGYGNVPEKYKEITKSLLSNFKYYNIREKEGVDIINKMVDKKANLVLDPTLLLNNGDYDAITSKISNKKPYVLLYSLTKSKTIIDFAANLAKKNNYDLIVINVDIKRVKGAKNIRTASPEEFLGYIKNAEYVVTSSFHGIIFSLIFNKQFYYELNSNKINNNSRLENISRLFDLENREIKEGFKSNLKGNIDYDIVSKKIKKMKNLSIEKLKIMLEDENDK